MELFQMLLFNGFWIFLGGVIILGVLTSFIVDIIKAILSPFRPENHIHINDVNVDAKEFVRWLEERNE